MKFQVSTKLPRPKLYHLLAMRDVPGRLPRRNFDRLCKYPKSKLSNKAEAWVDLLLKCWHLKKLFAIVENSRFVKVQRSGKLSIGFNFAGTLETFHVWKIISFGHVGLDKVSSDTVWPEIMGFHLNFNKIDWIYFVSCLFKFVLFFWLTRYVENFKVIITRRSTYSTTPSVGV